MITKAPFRLNRRRAEAQPEHDGEPAGACMVGGNSERRRGGPEAAGRRSDDKGGRIFSAAADRCRALRASFLDAINYFSQP